MPKRTDGALSGLGSSQAAALQYLRRNGPAPRTAIADLCGITPAAASMMTRDLLQRGLISEGARRQGGRGAPHVDLVLNPSAGYALGIHANRYAITLTLLDFCGNVIGDLQMRGSYRAFADVGTVIAQASETLLSQTSIGRSTVLGAGIAMPTRFGKEAVSLDLAEEIVSWAGSNHSGALSDLLGRPVLIENDANAAAVGEMALGNRKGDANFAYLYLSEGIGSGIMIGGQLYRGHIGNAGEIGALRARGMPRPSFEDLAQWCKQRIETVPDDRDPEAWSDLLTRHGDVLDAWLQRAGPETARLGFMMSAVLGPSAIYLGGTLPKLVRERLLPWLDFSRSMPFGDARVVQPNILLPDVATADPVAFGAAAMILHHADRF